MIPIYNLHKIFNRMALGGMLFFLSSQINAGFFDAHAKGWHWYELTEKESEESREEAIAILPPLEALGAIKQDLAIKRAKAVLAPTESNVYEYIKTQEKWATQAEHFSLMWQKVLTKYPELNYSLSHPTSELAKRVEQAEKQKQLSQSITMIKQDYGLFYFYRSGCAYCDKFAPILMAVAKRHGLSILPISLDGGGSSIFKEYKIDNGIAQKWGVTHVPALFAVSPRSQEIIPIAFGLMSQTELEQRFVMLAEYSKEKKSETFLAIRHQS